MLCYRKRIFTIAHTNTWFQVQSDQSNIFLRICFDSLIYEPMTYQYVISSKYQGFAFVRYVSSVKTTDCLLETEKYSSFLVYLLHTNCKIQFEIAIYLIS